MSPSATRENPEEYADSPTSAAPGAARSARPAPIDPCLRYIIEHWDILSEDDQAELLFVAGEAVARSQGRDKEHAR